MTGLLAAALLLSATLAAASTLTPLVRRHSVTIYASATTSQWCRQRVRLLWKARDPVLFHEPKRLHRLMQAVANRLHIECPQARVAVIRGVDAADGVTAYRGKATRGHHWRLKSVP